MARAPESLMKSHPGKKAMSAKHDDDADLYVRPFSITLLRSGEPRRRCSCRGDHSIYSVATPFSATVRYPELASGAHRIGCRPPQTPVPLPRCAPRPPARAPRRARPAIPQAAPACARRSRARWSGSSPAPTRSPAARRVTPFSAASFCSASTSALIALAVLAGEARQVRAKVAWRRGFEPLSSPRDSTP